MSEIRGRLLLVVVTVTALAGLFVGWIGGIARTGILGMTGPVGVVAGVLLFLAILIAIWFVLGGRRTIG